MRTFLLILLFLSIHGCASNRIKPSETTPVEVPPISSPSPTPSPIPPIGGGVVLENITFKCLNCDARETSNLLESQHKISERVKTQCFADRFILPKYRSDLIQTNGLTRAQVVERIRNYVIRDIPVKMYYDSRSGVYGYTYPNDPTLYFNRWYRTEQDYKNGDWSTDVEASNGLHEATHKMGFEHDYKRTARRPYSVPYTANYAMEDCVK